VPGDKSEKGKTNHLLCGHTNGLDAELASAEVEEVFKVRTQEVDDENVMETLLSKVVDLRNTDCVVSRGRGTREDFDGCKKQRNHIRVPFNVRYDRYSSRS